MAGTTTGDFSNGGPFYLDPNQQDLLLAALSSNTQSSNDLFAAMDGTGKQALNGNAFQYPIDNLDPTAFFTSPQQDTAAGFNNLGVEESPYVDYLDADGFDFDNADGDLMIGALPGDSPAKTDDGTEKRKSPDDDDDDDDVEEGGGKRRAGDDKQAKKPGRKPLTSEPTTVRLQKKSRSCACTDPHRNARHKTARHNAHSESARRSI
jgi:AP-1-like factor